MGMKQQRGGTILGFILGVVVGLAVALAVAVYVTKVPVQFMNKGQSRTPDQEAIDTKKNKDWDPNAPLYGKNPAKPIVPAEAAASAAAPGTGAAAPVVPKKELKPAVTADPLGDLANARGASVGNDPFIYFVQVGAYRTPEDAETQRAKLSLGGVETKVSEREQSGRTVFRVRAGPFDKREDADRIKEKLDASGMETALVRVQR
jgi:cell division protein FtsN